MYSYNSVDFPLRKYHEQQQIEQLFLELLYLYIFGNLTKKKKIANPFKFYLNFILYLHTQQDNLKHLQD